MTPATRTVLFACFAAGCGLYALTLGPGRLVAAAVGAALVAVLLVGVAASRK